METATERLKQKFIDATNTIGGIALISVIALGGAGAVPRDVAIQTPDTERGRP